MNTKYALVTPAYNEEKYIENLIKSVEAQTLKPKIWIIVNDGSNDSTPDIVSKYEQKFDYISRLDLKREDIVSYYSRRVYAVLAGIEKLKEMEFDYLAVLDADIIPEPNYYDGVISEFEKDPKLGIAAGIFMYQEKGQLKKALIDKLCTPGSNQIFRRKCYEQIGGYVPLRFGGDDSLCDILARMNGWKTQNFDAYPVVQHRIVGTGDGKSVIQARFGQGCTDYGIATHPVFMLAKCFRRSFLEKPYIIGGIARFAGFVYGYILGKGRKISPEAKRFVRKEQMKRLFKVF
jgi:glycosyltransferase involved in cell wall biosynthesis